MPLYQKTAHELQQLLNNHEIKAVEIVESVFQRIKSVDPKTRAYLYLTEASALAEAEKVDALRARGQPLAPLAGIPIALKDNIATAGVRTTCGSKILADYIPPYDAAVTELIQAGHLVMVGKTNLDEFGMGSSTENSAFFATKNPWDLRRVPGGSSGGSAAAVSAGATILALGSDTGGSIRQPAGYCGIVGLKPTYGRVSRYGLIAYASSLDQIGPLTKDVRDCALLMQLLAEYDRRDSTCINYAAPDYVQELSKDIRGLRIGLVREYWSEGISAAVKQTVIDAVKVYRRLGAVIVTVSLPHTEYALPAYYIIATAEASSNLARYDGVRYGHRTKVAVADSMALMLKTRSEGFGAEVKRRIMIGTFALSSGYYDAYYRKAQQVQTLIREDFNRAFKQCDLILTPATPGVAFYLGAKTRDPLEMYLEDSFTVTANLAGIPALSFPGGFDRGLPIGLQLLGPAFQEGLLLRAAYSFEQATGYHHYRPNL
ncbi:MAG TPA: Asp-tRNA(Asn)/Glu-tRNA(Gln) amidotransferase subunit GatA [Bacillota bacterium]